MNNKEMLKIRIETDLKWKKQDLRSKLKSLVNSLNCEIESLENKKIIHQIQWVLFKVKQVSLITYAEE